MSSIAAGVALHAIVSDAYENLHMFQSVWFDGEKIASTIMCVCDVLYVFVYETTVKNHPEINNDPSLSRHNFSFHLTDFLYVVN